MSHNKILKLGRRLGVQIEDEDKGLCNGVTILRVESRLANNKEQFTAPLQKLLTGNADILYESLTKAKQKIEAKTPLSLEETLLEKTLQFYRSTSVYQFPWRHSKLLKRHYNQQDYEVSQIVGCEAIKKAGGLAVIYSELGIYDEYEFCSFFKKLAKVIAKKNAGKELSIIVRSPLHVISLDLLPNEKWELFDINICTYSEESTILATPKLFNTFKQIFDSASKNLLLNIDVVTTGNKKQQLSQEFTNFERKFNLNDKLNTVEIEEMVVMAARLNKLTLLQELIKKKVSLDRISNDWTAAHNAAANGYLAIFAELVKHNVNFFDLRTSDGYTPALIAAMRGHHTVISELANYDKKFIEATNKEGMTTAFLAAQNGHVAVLGELAKHDIKLLGIADNKGDTPAFIAAQEGHAAVISELAKHDVKLLGIADNEGHTPATIAAQEGHAAVLIELASYDKKFIEATTKDGGTTALLAAQKGHVAVLIELAKHNVKLLGIANNVGNTPALIAAHEGHVAVLGELAKYDVKLLGIANNDGATPALIAAQKGHVAVLCELAKHDKKFLEATTKRGSTTACLAALNGHVAVLGELAKHDVKLLGIANSTGHTPASIAAHKGHVAVLAELAKHNKNLLSTSSYQTTPAYIAVLYNQVAVLQFLQGQGVDLVTPLTGSKFDWESILGVDSKFLRAFHKDKQAGDVISISLQELALILGQEESIQFFNTNLSTNPESLSCAMKIYNDSQKTRQIQDKSHSVSTPLATIGFYAAKNPKAIFDEGVAEFRQKNYQKALASLLEALEGFKCSSSTTAFQLARCYSTLASTQRELGYLKDAENSCNEALIHANKIQDTKTKTEEIKHISTKLDGLKKNAETAVQLR